VEAFQNILDKLGVPIKNRAPGGTCKQGTRFREKLSEVFVISSESRGPRRNSVASPATGAGIVLLSTGRERNCFLRCMDFLQYEGYQIATPWWRLLRNVDYYYSVPALSKLVSLSDHVDILVEYRGIWSPTPPITFSGR